MQKLAMLFLASAVPVSSVYADVLSSVSQGAGLSHEHKTNPEFLPNDGLETLIKATLPEHMESLTSIRGDWIADPDSPVTVSLCLKAALNEDQLQLMPDLSFFAKSLPPSQERYIYRYQGVAGAAGFTFSSLPGLDKSCSSIRMGEYFSFIDRIEIPSECPVQLNVGQNYLLLTFGSSSNNTVPGVYSYGTGSGSGGGCWGLCFWGSPTSDNSGGDGAQGGGVGKKGFGSPPGGGDEEEDKPVSYDKEPPQEATLPQQMRALLRTILRSSSQFKAHQIGRLADTLVSPLYKLSPTAEIFSWVAGLGGGDENTLQQGDAHQQWLSIFEILSQHPEDPMLPMEAFFGTAGNQMHLQSAMQQISTGTARQINQ